MSSTIRMMRRLEHLDGLRGVAIALVVLFHAYARWPQLILSFEPTWLSQGKMGVQLFFLISGFVIFMSLERSSGPIDFLRRRWLRLFPAMLVVSVFVYVTAAAVPRPNGQPSLRDLLPGLTFIEPDWWAAIIGSPQGVLEGSFWSLFVEAKFYVVAAAVFYTAGARAAIGVLLVMFVAPLVVGRFVDARLLYETCDILSAWHWGWFAAGALYYRFAASGDRRLFFAALAVSLLAASQVEQGCGPAAVCMALLFAAAQVSRPLQTLLSSRAMVFLGFVSYPLYLLHENLMVGLATEIHAGVPWLPSVLVPVLPMVAITALAWLVAAKVEPAVRSSMRHRRARPVVAG